jgi:hypothetical protein
MDHQGIDNMVSAWRKRLEPLDPVLRRAQMDDPWHHTMLEMMRRYAHMYDEAMHLEDVPEATRQRVLSMVLLGGPDGLESLAYVRAKELYTEAVMKLPPEPVYFPGADGKPQFPWKKGK